MPRRIPEWKRNNSGTATVEQVGILLLLASIFAVALSLYLTQAGDRTGRALGSRLANRIACGPRAPDACRRHPVVAAYGWDLARAVRWLAPPPASLTTAGGEIVAPVDFLYCQRPSCAVPMGDGRLTTANRRLTLFTEVKPTTGGEWTITYWFYRPSLGWQSTQRRAGATEIEAASGTRVLLKDSPRLVPLEILPGRNHYELPAGDEPPWRWRVDKSFPGRSA